MPTATEAISITLGTAVDPTRAVPFFSVSGPLAQTGTDYEDENKFTVERDSPRGVVYVPGSPGEVWVTNYYSATVSRYNASTGVINGSPIATGNGPIAICYSASAPASVWIANYLSDNVTRINASTGAIIETVALPAGATPSDIAADATSASIWTANSGMTSSTNVVTKIVVDTTSPYASVPTSYTGYAGYPASICYDPGSGGSSAYMWIGYQASDRISRFLCTSGALNSYDIGATNQYYSNIVYAPPGFFP